MAMYVIADLHLHPQGESLQRAFYAFVSKLHAEDELYILGDLFNFFVGLDKHNAAQKLVKDTLSEAKNLGVKTYFIRGNRDFLMTAKDAAWLNMELLPDIVLRTCGPEQVPVVLSHGDMFCTNDLAYMRYFKHVHNPCLQGIFRALPMILRRKIANSIREQSAQADRSVKGQDFYGVVDKTMDEYAQQLSSQQGGCQLPVPFLVHGHIHEFGAHTGLKNVQKRYVVGAWGDKFSYFKLSFQQDEVAYNHHMDEHHDLLSAANSTDSSNGSSGSNSSNSSSCGNGSMRSLHSDKTQSSAVVPKYVITFVEKELDYLLRPETRL